MANRCRRQLSFVLILFLGACATPDLRSFAEQSKNLAEAIATEQASVSGKIGLLADLAGAGIAEGWAEEDFDPDRYHAIKANYDASSKIISGILTSVVNYSTALANLAATGEDGKGAVEKVSQSLKGVTDVLGLAGPIVIGAAAQKILGELATVIGRIQAQNSLEKVMGEVENGKLPTRLAAAIGEIYAHTEVTIITEATEVEIAFRNLAFGAEKEVAARLAALALAKYYTLLSKKLAADINNTQCLTADKNAPGGLPQGCLKLPAGFKERTEQLATLSKEYRDHLASLAEIEAWRESHLVLSNSIREAVNLWATEHRTVFEALKKCGGLKVLNRSCGQLTFANLGAVASKIKGLAKEFDKDK